MSENAPAPVILLEGMTPHDVEVLRMLGGRREPIWGSWVGECLEFLAAYGLCTHGPHYKITDLGEALLLRAEGRGQ